MTQAFDDYAASRPNVRLPARQKRGPIELLIIDMQAHDRHGNIGTRDRIGAYLARLAAEHPRRRGLVPGNCPLRNNELRRP